MFYCVDETHQHALLAFVSWLFPHPAKHDYGKPVELWCNELFEPFGLHSFVPIENLVCRCSHVVVKHNSEHLSLIVPLV